ncbi:MAG: sigma-54-dependent Fis family transcriptional regulator [Myxococcales bacterium FL481]|nr:MAG: sigma-54-dependent Fis family transcriptional regulator [Myxococcales bacterium FL481]
MSAGLTEVLVVDDEEPVRHMLTLMLGREGFTVHTAESGEQALERLATRPIDVMLSDVRMPGMGGLTLVDRVVAVYRGLTVVVMSAFGSVDLALDAMKRGAYDYISKPFTADEVVLVLRKAEERERLRRDNARLRSRLDAVLADADRLGEMLVHSTGMRSIAATVRKVAAFKTTVLVLGESGVGKELVSRALHRYSPRAEGPFVAVNCGAIPHGLLESELFGHVRGAFTDAHQDRRGLFEQGHGGTVFLDEIGELPVELQVKLLRVVQEGEIQRIGDESPRRVDVRIVAATSRDLDEMVAAGSFRQDLYYRINVMPISVPPLRARRDDILPLVTDFLARINRKLGTRVSGITDEVARVLTAYHWPGNVRELENVLEHAAVLSEGPVIESGALPQRVRRPPVPEGARMSFELPPGTLSVKQAQRAVERELILRALEQTDGNRTHAARLLELSPRALLYKIKDYGLG